MNNLVLGDLVHIKNKKGVWQIVKMNPAVELRLFSIKLDEIATASLEDLTLIEVKMNNSQQYNRNLNHPNVKNAFVLNENNQP